MRLLGWGQEMAGGVREPAVAGRFYPGRASRLSDTVDAYLESARDVLDDRAGQAGDGLPQPGHRLVGVVAPHAGYDYSGSTAGFAYAVLDPAQVQRVVLLGPAHHVPVDGVGLSTAQAWRTPLGDVGLDPDVASELAAEFPFVGPADRAHAPEHSLEVQLPFLQRVLAPGWRLVPLIVGAVEPTDLGPLVARAARLPRTLVVVSTDLSHYLDYESAIAQDGRTIASVVHRRPGSIGVSDACGRYPLRGLLAAAGDEEWAVQLLDARNSGDTAGDRARVVGYAAFVVTAEVDAEAADREAATAGEAGAGAAGAGGGAAGAMAVRRETDSDHSGGDREPGASGHPDARIGVESRGQLLSLARATIEDALAAGGRRPTRGPEVAPGADPVLGEPGAAFVTLRSDTGELLGCIGSLTATRPLAADVAEHAYDAAFRDPRFPPLTRDRARGMEIDISVIGPSRPLPCSGYDDLLERLSVGSGVVVEAGRHRATFLPAVWEQLPAPAQFLAALWRKAGLKPGQWPEGITIELYESEEFAER